MLSRQPWFQREFSLGLPAHLLPVIIERLCGTPARLAERLLNVPSEILTRRIGDTWSIQENVGHLLDLESLWWQRLHDLLAQRTDLTIADLQNRRTHDANHNAACLDDLMQQFRKARMAFVQKLGSLSEEACQHTARHPRLQTPMNLVDLSYFVAEHDDYHLARMNELLVLGQG